MPQLPFDLRPPREAGPPKDRPVLTVTEINRLVQGVLREVWPEVWVEGEISNFRPYSSGHWYFTLKDPGSELSAVMFRGRNRRCRFEPEDGQAVLARGGLELYVDRGRYQLVVEELIPKGTGALQLAFEQLKKKLEEEGLFDQGRKQPLPLLPARVGVVTSRDGAALRDILRVLVERYANLHVIVSPCRVQGEGAADEIAAALRLLDAEGGCDVIIVGRGGGSLEDLWAFNEEAVARAISRCRTPVISAVGHETDVTISDLVADLRAATPSAAAEQVVERKDNLEDRVRALARRAANGLQVRLSEAGRRFASREPDRLARLALQLLDENALRIDDLHLAQARSIERRLERRRVRLDLLDSRLSPASLARNVRNRKDRVQAAGESLRTAVTHRLAMVRKGAARVAAELQAYSPLGVLVRGYALVRKDGQVVRRAADLSLGETVDVLLGEGAFSAEVRDSRPEDRPPSAGGEATGGE